MKNFRGLKLQALRDALIRKAGKDSLRPYLIDALNGIIDDTLSVEILREEGHDQVASFAFWIICLDEKDASIYFIRSDGDDESPLHWTSSAAVQARIFLPKEGTPPKSDKIVRLAEQGVVTITCLLFIRSVDGQASVLHARHPDLKAEEAADYTRKLIGSMLKQRWKIN